MRRISHPLLLVGLAAFGTVSVGAQTRPTGAAGNRAERLVATSRPVTPKGTRLSIQQILDSRVAEVNFDNTALEDVLAWLEEYTGALVYARWAVLKDYGIDPDTPITLKTRNRQLSRILWVVMNEAAGPADITLAYQASDDLIVISTHEDLSRKLVTRVYDVSGFAPDVYRFWLTQMRQTAEGSEGIVWRTKVQRYPAPSAGRIGSDVPLGAEPPVREITTDDERLQEMMELVLNTIEPETWEINGYGGQGTIFPYKGHLMVRNSLYVHQMISSVVEPASEYSEESVPAKDDSEARSKSATGAGEAQR